MLRLIAGWRWSKVASRCRDAFALASTDMLPHPKKMEALHCATVSATSRCWTEEMPSDDSRPLSCVRKYKVSVLLRFSTAAWHVQAKAPSVFASRHAATRLISSRCIMSAKAVVSAKSMADVLQIR